MKELDDLPPPSRELTPNIINRGGLLTISSSRGCYNHCSYCTINQFYTDPPGNHFRLRSADNVSDELIRLKKEFPQVADMWFVDDNFIQSGKKGFERTSRICSTLKSLGLRFDIYLRADNVDEKTLSLLKDAGIRSVFIGAESGCDDTLEHILHKGTFLLPG